MNPEIIIIDDDEILLIILEKMIKKVMGDLDLKTFNSGTSALAFLRNNPKAPEVSRFLLVDINLKDMTGWEFLTQLEQEKNQDFKAIVITSSVSLSNHSIAEKFRSVISFYEKPITFKIIEQIHEEILKNKN